MHTSKKGEITTTLAIFSLLLMAMGVFFGSTKPQTTGTSAANCLYSADNQILDVTNNPDGVILQNVSGFSWQNSFKDALERSVGSQSSGSFPSTGKTEVVWNTDLATWATQHPDFQPVYQSVKDYGRAFASVELINKPDNYEVVGTFTKNCVDSTTCNEITITQSSTRITNGKFENIKLQCGKNGLTYGLTYGWKVRLKSTTGITPTLNPTTVPTAAPTPTTVPTTVPNPTSETTPLCKLLNERCASDDDCCSNQGLTCVSQFNGSFCKGGLIDSPIPTRRLTPTPSPTPQTARRVTQAPFPTAPKLTVAPSIPITRELKRINYTIRLKGYVPTNIKQFQIVLEKYVPNSGPIYKFQAIQSLQPTFTNLTNGAEVSGNFGLVSTEGTGASKNNYFRVRLDPAYITNDGTNPIFFPVTYIKIIKGTLINGTNNNCLEPIDNTCHWRDISQITGDLNQTFEVTFPPTLPPDRCPYNAKAQIFKQDQRGGLASMTLSDNGNADNFGVSNDKQSSYIPAGKFGFKQQDGYKTSLGNTAAYIYSNYNEPFLPTPGALYKKSGPADVRLIGLDENRWKIVRVYCKSSSEDDHSCPANPERLDPVKLIEGFHPNCSTDIQYGWIVEDKLTPTSSPTLLPTARPTNTPTPTDAPIPTTTVAPLPTTGPTVEPTQAPTLQTIIIPVTQDAYVASGANYRTKNMGREDKYEVDAGNSHYVQDTDHKDWERALIQFDLTLMHGAVVKKATININSNSGGSTVPIEKGNPLSVHKVLGSWRENYINWNNQPSFDPQSIIDVFNAHHSTALHGTDLPINLVQEWIDNPVTNYGLLLKSTEQRDMYWDINYHSREDKTNKEATLTIEYIGNPVTPPSTNSSPIQSELTNIELLDKADGNHDFVINSLDFARIIRNYGATGSNITEDINSDGTVNSLDISFVTAAFDTNLSNY